MGPVCWRQCVPFQIIRCIFLYICFPSLHVSQTRKRFSPASLPLYAPGYPSHVWVSRSLLQHSHSAAWCIIQFLLWLRHSNVADWHVQSVNPELVTSGTLRTVARSTLSLQYSSGTGDIRHLEDRCNIYSVTVIFIRNWWYPVPWGPLQDLQCHCNIHKSSGRHVVFIRSLCLGGFSFAQFLLSISHLRFNIVSWLFVNYITLL